HPPSALFPYTTLFRSADALTGGYHVAFGTAAGLAAAALVLAAVVLRPTRPQGPARPWRPGRSQTGVVIANQTGERGAGDRAQHRSEEHTSELQSLTNL